MVCFLLTNLVFAATAAATRDSTPLGAASECVIDVAGAGNSAYGTRELYGVKISVLEVLRGDEAWERIRAADSSNKPPDPGLEYVLALVRFEYFNTTGSTVNLPYTVNKGDFKTYSGEDQEYEQPSIVPPQPGLIGAVFYPGTSQEGWIPFRVATGDEKPLMFFFGGLWFRLY
jgi:hypothetical protein